MAETLTVSLPEELSAALKKQAQAGRAGVDEVVVRLLTEAVRATGTAALSVAEVAEAAADLATRLSAASSETSGWLREVLVGEVEDALVALWQRRPVDRGPWVQLLAVLVDALRLNPAGDMRSEQLRALSSVAARLASLELAGDAVSSALDALEDAGLSTSPDIPDAVWEASTDVDDV